MRIREFLPVVVTMVALPILTNFASNSPPDTFKIPLPILVQRRAGGGSDSRRLDPLAAACRDLAAASRGQWREEAVARNLTRPRPLRVRWTVTDRPVRTRPASVLADADLPQRSLLRATGDLTDLAHRFRQLPHRQVVVLGDRGSGKSALAVLLTLDLLTKPEPAEPIPLIFSLASWHPSGPGAEHLHTWLARRMTEEYLFLKDDTTYGADAARTLIKNGRILPILDGLDEMHHSLRAAAIQEIDRAAGDGPLVLTSRGDEYETALSEARAPVLTRAQVIELRPVTVPDALTFLDEHAIDPERWRPLQEGLASKPDGPLGQALRTPLMVWLFSQVYAEPGTEPTELLNTERFQRAYGCRTAPPGITGTEQLPVTRDSAW
jgi:hypothetical protein